MLPFYYLWSYKYGDLASDEAFSRYWSWYQFAYLPQGINNVLSAAIYQPDYRFLNPFNGLYR